MTIRFIEYMENQYASKEISGLKSDELLKIIGERYSFKDEGFDGSSPSHYYIMDDGYRFGIIEPHEDDFCKQCNRIRLTAEGNLIPCLYFDEAMSIAESIKKGDIKGAASVLKEVVRIKPEKNRWGGEDGESSSRAFYETGG
jgi:cyclic pyranopterin phosphate synthase